MSSNARTLHRHLRGPAGLADAAVYFTVVAIDLHVAAFWLARGFS
jgi:hypothetical protein